MQFTYSSYLELIKSLRHHGYSVTNYRDWKDKERCAILRHDIDYDVDCALKLAEIEADEDIQSTYFVLLTSDFYNPHSSDVREKLKRIDALGHEIGLHYDELSYKDAIADEEKITNNIIYEGKILADIIGKSVSVVSMHRPSKGILDADLKIPGFINSYGYEFFHDFKYVSDSRRRWREPIDEYIGQESFDKLHILTHAFWYKKEEEDLKETLREYISKGSIDRYSIMNKNFTKLEDVLSREEI